MPLKPSAALTYSFLTAWAATSQTAHTHIFYLITQKKSFGQSPVLKFYP